MSDKAWKRVERMTARLLGGQRVALSGGPGATSRADVLAGGWFVECKHRRRCAVATWYDVVCGKALAEGRQPLLVIHVAGSARYLAVVDIAQLQQLLVGHGAVRQSVHS